MVVYYVLSHHRIPRDVQTDPALHISGASDHVTLRTLVNPNLVISFSSSTFVFEENGELLEIV